MKTCTLTWDHQNRLRGDVAASSPDVVILFGPRELVAAPELFSDFRTRFPASHVLGCSTGGQIHDGVVSDAEVVGLGLDFAETTLRFASTEIKAHAGSREAGQALGRRLACTSLAGIFVLADGLALNGTDFVAGLAEAVGEHIPLMGGLAGDGARLVQTLVIADAAGRPGIAAAVGFYGEAVRLHHGHAGGWDRFGPKRRITRSRDNILFELDGRPALELYERYLGEEAAGLPGTGLLFPLRIFNPANPDHDVVRTLLAIDREQGSVTFAGSMPQGWVAQLMRGSLDRLAHGAGMAADHARIPDNWTGEGAAFLISCIGRRLLMGQRTGEEVAAVRAALRRTMPVVGFYSYGEISPHLVSGFSELHNQTMTVMTITERAA